MSRETKESLNMRAETLAKLIMYLKVHENDIATGINDFGDLTSVFISLMGRCPCRLDV